MNKLDKDYQALLQDILDNGHQKGDRTGTGTISTFGRQIRHNMKDGFPLLTTKKMYFRGVVTELLWFLRGDTNIKYLVDNNCHIWDGDAYRAYLRKWKPQPVVENELHWMEQELVNDRPLPKDMFIHCIKTDDEFAKKFGELGPIYGKQWRNWKTYKHKMNFEPYLPVNKDGKVECYVEYVDQIANLINDLKTNPDSRRLMVTAWNPSDLESSVLPPCHYGFQVYTRELSNEEIAFEANKVGFNLKGMTISGKLIINPKEVKEHNLPTRAISLIWNQRSVDTFLGLPFNIASYGLLLEIIAKEVNMVPDELIGNLGDTHLYSNHIEQAKEQIGRSYTHEERTNLLKDAMSHRIYNKTVNELIPFGGGMSEYYESYNIPRRTREPYPLPQLNINTEFWNKPFLELIISDNFCKCLLEEDIQLGNYQSHPTIKAPLSN